ncbi:N-acetylmuramoyl-L-alanine amidase [Secundilactobacillus collinoides]|uniref:N-acetylmuramoyl-L-alanine amidase n=1 Tax=Secundilactobacillus collinoides TaxID=33960 RepID=UPI0006D1EFFA|nr:peptidoglycan recognition family protein [Secundilactobacillus collinoides]
MKTNQIPAKRSNYTRADRPEQVPVTHIVIHSTELSYPETVQRFQEAHDVSAHYVLRQSDGLVTQMVAPHNVAWHAGNWELNCRAVGIEQEAYVGEPESFTKTMLRSLTTLVSQLSTQFNVPLDRDHLLGHDNLCAMTASGQLAMHQDPGRYFDWRQLLTDLGASVEGRGVPVVGEPVVVCVMVADLYQSPEQGAKLLTDETLPGWTHQVSYGQRFVCADKKR